MAFKVMSKKISTPPTPEPDEREALSRMYARLEQMQIRLPDRPLGKSGEPLNPQLPYDLTSLNDVKLGQLYSEFCTMAQYAQMHTAITTVEKAIAKQREKFMRAKVRLQKEGTVPDKEAQVEVDSSVRKRVVATLTGEGIETLTQSMLQGYLIGRDAISREMTRRTSLMHPEPFRGR